MNTDKEPSRTALHFGFGAQQFVNEFFNAAEQTAIGAFQAYEQRLSKKQPQELRAISKACTSLRNSVKNTIDHSADGFLIYLKKNAIFSIPPDVCLVDIPETKSNKSKNTRGRGGIDKELAELRAAVLKVAAENSEYKRQVLEIQTNTKHIQQCMNSLEETDELVNEVLEKYSNHQDSVKDGLAVIKTLEKTTGKRFRREELSTGQGEKKPRIGIDNSANAIAVLTSDSSGR
mmetsp:Transcript_310/g.332  ORF Transcript_310/g.332 Transcript_310/m.332 type:complete len:232 (+) Transcript_310:108-803(+)